MSDILNIMRPLTHDERLKARDRAAKNLVGPVPQRKDFAQHTQSKYPPRLQALILALVAVVLLAAFAISTPRLYMAGYIAAIAADANETVAQIAGVAFFMLAETAQIVFSLAITTVEAGRNARRVLWAGVILATLIAIVGNLSIAMPPRDWQDAHFFVKWFDAIAPPLLVVSVAYVLKERILDAVQLRYANEVAYQAALATWQAALQNPEANDEWMHYYMQALRDTLLAANARGQARDARKDMSTQEWVLLLQREFAADDMLREMQAAVQEKEMHGRAAKRRVHKRGASPSMNGSAAGMLADALHPEGDAWVATCPNCNEMFHKQTRKSARLALTAHLRKCMPENETEQSS